MDDTNKPSSTRLKHSNRNPYYPITSNHRNHNHESNYYEDDDELDDEEEEEEEENHEFENSDNDNEDYEEDIENGFSHDSEIRHKKRRFEGLVSNYEFVPRRPRNFPVSWTENDTFLLIEEWGDRFSKLGRTKSLSSEDWEEVAEKVAEGSRVEWTGSQCRNRIDMLKNKYEQETEKLEESKWVFFKKMDMFLNSPSRPQCGLPCGVDSGEYVFMKRRVCLKQFNALDEMRDSPAESEEEDDENGLSSKRKGFGGEENDGSLLRLLANSVQKFGEIYKKTENSKRKQMMELEKMRMDFQRDLEVQKKQILERAQAEIAKIQRGDDDDDDDDDDETFVSEEYLSG